MADDWDTVTKIGSRVGGGGGGGPRLTTIKNKSQLNAAQRAGGIVGTEKKYGTANSSRSEAGSGQFLTKVDRSDDIVKPKTGDKELGMYIMQNREQKKLGNRLEFGKKVGINEKDLARIEKGEVPITQDQVNRIERGLEMFIRGVKKGEPKVKTFKRAADKK
ncbi:multiprotein-bridging factor 1 [Pyricularia oryzae]|uniref:Multiprotein-bridging factor 1 n=3 Tax=Pyricularia TaxID=48558 RepID=MBF1_PYRO7|nr:multiprotein-bridging factor 1 [Pyricularia oryzae 70-15]Q52BY4.1 RecName: Full=Multiprotein-bridging factor 1 [Pyricularia oryzae 70-15]ADD84644.1 MBF1 [Pyricularia oryzae]KAI6290966.1 multiprotein-bridging factor 1 [Pyricularia grisea]EHA55375.1 multiprotein-bridging factor 1 [Pyricularia oryzae 70-15]KAH8839580.1 multiprotein-bridging factor 1 [Pyricularia oryzae]KAH9439439.1 multiprotein-bridging factor 1 [Pyricularia oryzae]